MKNLAIGRKLLLAFGILALVVVTIAGMSLWTQGRLNHSTEVLGKERRDKLVAIATVNTATSDYRIAEATVILSLEPGKIREADQAATAQLALIDKNLTFLDKAVTNPKARTSLARFRQLWTAFIARSEVTRQLGAANRNEEATQAFRASQPLFDRANNEASTSQDIQVALMDKEMGEARSLYSLSRVLSLGLVVAALALAGFLLLALIRGIATPIKAMTEALGKLAGGDLNAQVAVDERADEVGQLAKVMVQFRNQLAAAERAKAEQTALIVDNIGRGLSALAQGDLTARIDAELTGPFAKLKTDFNEAMAAVSAAMAAVTSSATGITNGANDIRQASDDLSQRTEQQAASLEETAAAMHEITTTVKETAETATRADAVVVETRRDAEASGDVVRRAVEAMNGIERSSSEISEIIAVIDGIAFQTNLLALNAGVEAARAGDAGKGFAVVASEVRALAQRSADAAKDVKTKITASTEQVDLGVGLVAEAGAALQRITSRIGEISTLVGSIASAAEQQATGLQQVNTAVSEMDGVTQQNAAMVEEATAAARSLVEETDVMAREVGRFRLATGAAGYAAPTASPVHQMQARAAQAGARIAATARSRGSAAVAVQEDWSEF
ncbi:methyl-accepting chemotaxis protein [Sphingomonas phyllosphaerae]|uniref:methyl-accepting chemotaxis protein n=1 Tax=Sphingomonas phyllosphaerae TaxID=257003 RepID=UPI0004167109|nr:methyl-accepting chemotaxis protein [Sphingomonas phyllosphaerae]